MNQTLGKPCVSLTPLQLDVLQDLARRTASGELNWIEIDCPSGTPRSQGKILRKIDRYGIAYDTLLDPKSGLLWSSPVLDDASLNYFYKDMYRELYFSAPMPTDQFFNRQIHDGRRMVGRIKPFIGSGHVLDIGCGAGGCLRAFVDAGFTGAGCDFDPDYVSRGQEVGLELVLGDAGALRGQQGDVVYARHVLEHAADPMKMLLDMASLTRDNGLVYIEVPGVMRAFEDYRHFGRYIHLAHITHFSLCSLDYLAGKAGLKRLAGTEEVWAIYRKVGTPVEVDTSREAARIEGYIRRMSGPVGKAYRILVRPIIRFFRSRERRKYRG